MIPGISGIFIGITLVISLIVPLLCPIVFARRERGRGITGAWLAGALGFLIPQMLIRIPILSILQSSAGFSAFSAGHPFAFVLALAFTAGLFELAGRISAALLLQKRPTFSRALAAGMGHGGIESIILVGISYAVDLICVLLVRSGADVTAQQALIDVLASTPPALFLLAGFERLLTMLCHCAISCVVCCGIWRKRPLPGLAFCLIFHTLLDGLAGISQLIGQNLPQAAAYALTYTILTIFAAISLWILKTLPGRWPEEDTREVDHASKI